MWHQQRALHGVDFKMRMCVTLLFTHAPRAASAALADFGSILRLLLHAHSSISSSSVDSSRENTAASNPAASHTVAADSHRLLQATGGSSSSSSSWPTLSVTVDAARVGRAVPETFLATSHEYTRIYDYGNTKSVAAWGSVFGMLSSSPIIRVGGASQDKMLQVPGDDVWLALKRLQGQTNCR
jgi:hypothetical protein